MTVLVQMLQALSGILWLLPAVYLSPRIVQAWQVDATRTTMLSAPNKVRTNIALLKFRPPERS